MFKKSTFIFVSIVVLTLFILGILYYQNELKGRKVNHILDQITLTLESQLKFSKMNDLKIALLLSQNKTLIDTLENDDEDLGYQILNTTMQAIHQHTGILVKAQIITKELNIFARSWDDVYAGMPLGDYRTDLLYFKKHKVPRTSLEIGRRLGIKATVPIYKDAKLLGFIEVISFFKPMTKFFNSIGMDIYVLLNIKDSDSAVFMRDNLSIDEYIVSNRDYNYNNVQTLQKINFKDLALHRILHIDNKYIFFIDMQDGSSNSIGAFVFVLNEKYLNYFRDEEDDISFLINITKSSLYNIINNEKAKKNIYSTYNSESMLYLQSAITKEDKELFLEKAYKKLDLYSKDELIQILLEKKIVKKINGKIK